MKRFLSLVAAALCGAMVVGSVAVAVPILAAPSINTCTQRSDVALSTSSEVLFAANLLRKSVTVTNNDSSIAIYIKRGSTATSGSLRVPAGQTYELVQESGHIWTGTIDAIAASGTPAISAEECF